MSLRSYIAVCVLGLGLSACGFADVTSRNASFDALAETDAVQGNGAASAAAAAKSIETAPGKSPVTVKSVKVTVPETLTVSEANRFLPAGDIVWREDPPGDRYKQVQTIVYKAMKQGVAPLDGPVQVKLEVEVLKFHALTQKARYSTGGIHGLSFRLAIRDAATGDLIAPVRTVRADTPASGGRRALAEEAAGLTQKVVISNHLAEVIREELTRPEGYKGAKLGLIQTLNYM